MAHIADSIARISSKGDAVAALGEIRAEIDLNVRKVEPYVAAHFSKICEATADKAKKQAAVETAEALLKSMSPFAVSVMVPALVGSLAVKAKPPQKEAALNLVSLLAKSEPEMVGRELVTLIPIVSDLMNDVKKDVAAAARACMEAICGCTGNKDLEPFIPYVIEASQDQSKAAKCVEKLASCVFVQNVEAAALAATTPVLRSGLRDRNEELKRTCCVIIDNMCKLVEDPNEVQPLMPRLEPLVKMAAESIADPEARGIAEKAHKTLLKAAGDGAAAPMEVGVDAALATLNAVLAEQGGADDVPAEVRSYVAALAAAAANARRFDAAEWAAKVCVFLGDHPDATEAFLGKIRVMAAVEEAEEEEDEDEARELYKGSFSLAYGTLTLLRETMMNLKWNKFYGLLGPNNCGKTTLMRAIANEQLEGFPKRDELLSVFVEHEIADKEVGVREDGFPIMSVDLSGIEWVVDAVNTEYGVKTPVTSEIVSKMMHEIGFGKDRAADPDSPVTTYSGGWKMKMQLCAAALANADVLMLDEPTGHLDVTNVEWLKNWLRDFPGSIICTSHDSSFLNEMCTHIIDFQDRKLKTFKGDAGRVLAQFVEKYPEKKGYFELKNDVVKFVFPAPGSLEGIKSRSKVILKMNDVSFTYPSRTTPTITDINLKVSQISRVAVIGANGAGKSTAIKVLVGEAIATSGTVWKAPGMRMAYVAQHAFHHLEKHLDKTPCQYLMWRFAGNDDKESLEFKSDDLSTDESTLREQKWIVDPARGTIRKVEKKEDEKHVVVPEAIMNRRMNKKDKTKEYEVKWQFKDIADTHWVDRETLVKMGYLKMVQREDERQAAMAGLMTKHLTQQGIEKHLKDFGLDEETVSHTAIRHLSGGQKVKVVLGAAMWQNPHLLILDEPTNYLDRDGLGALTLAIRAFQGGVLVISHNREFCEGVAQEKWIMQAGKLRIEGASVDPDATTPSETANKVEEDVVDAAGNKIDAKKTKTLSDKDKKKQIKAIEKKIKDGKKNKTLTDEQIWELEDELAALNTALNES